jgi:hypothetical protein
MLDKFQSINDTLILSKANLNRLVDKLNAVDKMNFQSEYSTAFVQNLTGFDITSMLSIVGINSELIYNPQTNLAAFINYPTFKGVTPDSDLHENNFAILLSNAKQSQIVEARMTGISPVRVNIIDADHTFAELVTGVTGYLQSSESGSIQILSRQSGLGLKYCLVKLNGVGEITYLYKSTSDENSGFITAKKLNSAGYMTGDDETFVVVPEIDE